MYVRLYWTTFGMSKLWHEIFPDSFGCISQALRSTDQGTNVSCLHLGATMGQQSGKQGAAWLTLLCSLSKDAPDGPLPSCWSGAECMLLLITGRARVLHRWRDIGGACQLLSEDCLHDSLPVYLLARAARQCVCKPNLNHVQTLASGLLWFACFACYKPGIYRFEWYLNSVQTFCIQANHPNLEHRFGWFAHTFKPSPNLLTNHVQTLASGFERFTWFGFFQT